MGQQPQIVAEFMGGHSHVRQDGQHLGVDFPVIRLTGNRRRLFKTHLLGALKKRGIYALAIFQGTKKRSICFAFSEKIVNHAIHALEQDSSLRLLGIPFSRFQVADNLALITAVGREIFIAPQVQQKISVVLENAGVGMKIIRASPDSLVFSVANKDGENAIKQIHDQVILNDSLIAPINQPVLSHQSAI